MTCCLTLTTLGTRAFTTAACARGRHAPSRATLRSDVRARSVPARERRVLLQTETRRASSLRIRAAPEGGSHQTEVGDEKEVQNSDDQDGAKGEQDDAEDDPLEGIVSRLVASRYDEESARKVLKTFDELGIKDEEGLKDFFAKVSFPALAGQAGQVVLTFVAAGAAVYLEISLAGDPDAPELLKIPLAFVLGATGFTLGLEAFWASLLLAISLFTTFVWGLNPKAFLNAVRETAGDLSGTGLGVVDKATELARAATVALRLLELQSALGEKLASDSSSETTLDRLGAMLTLSNAREKYGFSADKLGIDEEEAIRLARTFGRFDRSNTGRLNSNDFADLARELGMQMSMEEANEALRMLDENGNGVIEFNEFASWYQRKVEIMCTPDEGCTPVLGDGKK